MELREHPFFNQLEAANAEELTASTDVGEFASDTVIFEEGGPSDGLYLVLEGAVAFCKQVPGGGYRVVSHSHAGDFFGEIGLFTGQPRSLRAEARGKVVIATIGREALVKLIGHSPGLIEGVLKNIVNHLHDTTRHYVEDMLRQEKMALVGGMMNTIIHDFKNPFCLISLAAQIIGQIHNDEKTLKLCRNIDEQIQRMVKMAEEVNLFSRGESKLQLADVRVPALMERFKELNFPYFENPTVAIEVDVPDVVIAAEESRFLRVFQNLVGNAIDAFGKEEGTVRISGRVEDGSLLLEVADDGNGIPEDIRANFFDPFVTYGKHKGTGLGTAIVKSIVEAHGGEIRFDTATGEGTTFHIRMPLAAA